MRDNSTELVFILDKSGSMAGIADDTIGGFNANLKKQQGDEGEAYVTTALFNDRYELLHDRKPIREVRPITDREYEAGGMTALLDAIGKTIALMVQVQKKAGAKKRSDKVLFVIITDGMENASREYSLKKVREMVSFQQEKYGWEFLFLGANIDAVETAMDLGIRKDRAVDFCPDAAGMNLNYEAIYSVSKCMKSSGRIDENWKKEIAKDYESRGGGKKR